MEDKEYREETGYESRLDQLDDDGDYEEPKVSYMIDEFWKPKEGEEIRGVYLETRRYEKTVVRNGKETIEEFYGVVLQTKNGIYNVNENKFLKQRMATVKPGDGVKIKFTGKRFSQKAGFNYNTYDVGIKRFSKAQEKEEPENTEEEPRTADSIISQIMDVLRAEGNGEEKNVEAIVREATSACDMGEISPEELLEVKRTLAERVVNMGGV